MRLLADTVADDLFAGDEMTDNTPELFGRQPSSLEAAISQAANDLKVTGFGQRVRAVLRRNRAAEDSILPGASYGDLVGPDLVRELNALWLLATAGDVNLPTSTRLDQELLGLLHPQLDIARAIVASLWDGPLSDCAAVFVDYDNVPFPLCPMYLNARELIPSNVVLPTQLGQIVERLRSTLHRVPLMQAATDQLPALTPDYLAGLAAKKTAFKQESAYHQGETVLEWQERIHAAIRESRADLPLPLVQLNRLIHVTVQCLVSLAVWDHRATPADVSSCERWGAAPALSPTLEDSHPSQAAGTAMSYGPWIPEGYELRVTPPRLVLLPFDAAIRMCDETAFRGISLVVGASMSWSKGKELDARLRITTFDSYEAGAERSS